MKNLHDLFDKLGIEKVKSIAELMDKKKIGSKAMNEVAAMVFAAYSLETGIEPGDVVLKTEELNNLFQHFLLSASLYANITNGDMAIKGRMALINDKATYSLTEQGKRDVEERLLKGQVV